MHASPCIHRQNCSADFIGILPVVSKFQIRGVSERCLLWVHGFRNALPSVITLFAMQLPGLLSGTVLTETVFVWLGIGQLGYEASLSCDYPVIMGITLVITTLVIAANLLADILSFCLNPQERHLS